MELKVRASSGRNSAFHRLRFLRSPVIVAALSMVSYDDQQVLLSNV